MKSDIRKFDLLVLHDWRNYAKLLLVTHSSLKSPYIEVFGMNERCAFVRLLLKQDNNEYMIVSSIV